MKTSEGSHWNERTTQQLVRYEALFSLLTDIQAEEDIERIAGSVARKWKYFANAASWRLVLLRNDNHLLVEASRGEAVVTNIAELPEWDAALLETLRPRLIPVAEAPNIAPEPPPSITSSGVREIQVLPLLREERCIALLSVAARHEAFSDLDHRFIRLFGGYLTDRLTSILTRHEATEVLINRATVDPLTGLLNRGAILERSESLLASARSLGEPLSIVLGDIDFFKPVNDTHGHHAGDEVLREVARRLRATLRKGEWVGRYGGEEFVVVLDACGKDRTRAIAERLCEAIASAPVTIDAHEIGITMSFGMATFDGAGDETLESMLKRADRALYRAKAEGRNRVVADDEQAT
ncbi:GGDEF domain-containing protein [Ectothiorhodospira marina]|jgi:diguanylate cyclase (GGDEF)-like protein|uniref:diguanylate cyclase n=1 Tax=Ectothiorhodospira marina TaxID=1396821 RepID=A0A1H7Q3H8_9GAMM|nr:GGDEF domain-containing protein [Ectothiorhodospira marina]SEL42288.1 diguanylate cyclase (GGDEF) domain-containing protein [Ectothiorhodospira marina]